MIAIEVKMASPEIDRLTREDIIRTARGFQWSKKMPKWTAVVEDRELPARPLVLTAAGVTPNDPTNSHMAIARLKALGFETRYDGIDEPTANEIRPAIEAQLNRLTLLSPEAWAKKADDLLDAAAVLEPSVVAVWQARLQNQYTAPGILGVHLMLVSFGIENLFKSALVRARRAELTKELDRKNELPEQLKKHKLIELAKSVDFNHTIEDEVLFHRLARAAIWSGRYPIATDLAKRSRMEKFSDGKCYSVATNLHEDVKNLRNLVSRIREKLKV